MFDREDRRDYIHGTYCIRFKDRVVEMCKLFRKGLLTIAFVMVFLAPVSAVNTGVNTISRGGYVFIGEEGLDITGCIGNATLLAWFGPGSGSTSDAPSYVIDIGDPTSFYIAPGIFIDKTGPWYQWYGSLPAGPVAVNVLEPYLETGVRSQATGGSVSYGNVPQGDFLNFFISSNMWTVSTRPGYDPSRDGFLSYKVKSPEGTIYSGLHQNRTYVIPLTGISIDSTYETWVPTPPPYNEKGWNTGVTDSSGTLIYGAGIYEVTVETNLNGIKDNYRDPAGADYIGKTVAYPQLVTIGSDTLSITASESTIVRGNQFSITLRGMPSEVYIIWVENTEHMTGLSKDQPPTLRATQSGLRFDPASGPYTFGGYQFQGGNGRTIKEDVPLSPVNGTLYYGRVSLSSTGSRTIGWQTTSDTKDRTYTIRAERGPPGPNGLPDIFSTVTDYISADVDIRVEKGSVTIVTEKNDKAPEPEKELPESIPSTTSAPPTPPPVTLTIVIPATSISTVPTPPLPYSPAPTQSGGFVAVIALGGLAMAALFLRHRP